MQVAHIGHGCDDTVSWVVAEGTVDFVGTLPLARPRGRPLCRQVPIASASYCWNRLRPIPCEDRSRNGVRNFIVPKMLSCSKWRQDDMANDNRRDPGAATERELPKDIRSPAKPLPQSGPRILNDGPELLRSNLC
jgi:hypothetical protein